MLGLTHIMGRLVREITQGVTSMIQRAVMKKEDKTNALWLQELAIKKHPGCLSCRK